MAGEPDPLYVLARRALLDGLAALEPHLDAIVVIGAQAIYVHTGSADLAVAEFTTDADLAIAPEFLACAPSIGDLLTADGFELHEDPGKWTTADGIQVDLLVPGALVDSEVREISALDRTDGRSFHVAVAGPAALFVAKIHKIAERVDEPDRLVEKDALDVLRLLRSVSTHNLAEGLQGLAEAEVARDVTAEAIDLCGGLLAQPDAPGPRMAARATGGLEDPTTVAMSLATLASDLLARTGNPQ